MSTTEAPNAYTKKRKSKKYDQSASDICSDDASEERKAKRWKKQDDSNINAETAESIRQNEKRKKKEEKRLRQEATAVEYDEDLDQDKKDEGKTEHAKRKNKEKKRSKKQATANVGDPRPHEDTERKVERLAIPSTLGSTKKKKRTNKTGFLDPTEDASLSDQARKALAYAFIQFYRPSKWKFHKARQNWIVRNVLSVESIPDAYFPLAVAYLTKIQGGARENLLKHCTLSLEPSKVQDLTPETITPDASGTPTIPALPAIDLVKVARAKALIHDLDVNIVAHG